MSCGAKGFFIEEEVYGKEVSVGFQRIPGSGR